MSPLTLDCYVHRIVAFMYIAILHCCLFLNVFFPQIPDLPYIRRGHECRGEFKMSSPSPVMVSLHVSEKFSSGTLNPTQSNKPTENIIHSVYI